MANPSLQIGNSNWAIKKDNLLGYSTAGTRFLPIPITMTRASAGTRVNSSGLVETVELLGSEDVVDGNFPLPNNNWILGGSGSNIPTIGTNDVTINSVDGNSYIQQSSILTSGKTYKITYDVISASATSNVLKLASSFGLGSIPTSAGTQIVYGTAISSNLYIERYTNGVNATIANVSVKESTVNDLARVNYTGSTSSLLAEPQRTNLLPYSEDFEKGNWTKTRCTAVINQGISPDGNQNASIITSTGADARIEDQVGSSGAEYTQSIYVKSAQATDVDCQIDFGGLNIVTFSANQEWQRVDTTLTNTSYSPRLRLRILNSGNSVYVWGGQLESGSYATSYIPTSGSTVTRVQDQYTKTGISDKINSEEGVLFVEMAELSNDGTDKVMTLSDGTNSNRVTLYYSSSSNQLGYNVVSGGSVSAFHSTTLADSTSFVKVAVKWKVNDFALWVNGVEISVDSSGITFSSDTLNSLHLSFPTGSTPFFGKVKQLQVFKTALTDSELATLTTI